MSDTVTIRRAARTDRDAIGRLWLEMLEFHTQHDPRFFRLKPDASEIGLRYLDDCLVDENQFIVVAEAGGGLVGFAMGRSNEDPPPFAAPPHGFVTNFAVTSAWRRRGLGKQLFEALVAEFHGHGLADIRLSVSAHNPASNRFWRRMGFEPYMVTMRRKV
jgi:ribosomal protein S18 acetylase RimI-like enzyme